MKERERARVMMREGGTQSQDCKKTLLMNVLNLTDADIQQAITNLETHARKNQPFSFKTVSSKILKDKRKLLLIFNVSAKNFLRNVIV